MVTQSLNTRPVAAPAPNVDATQESGSLPKNDAFQPPSPQASSALTFTNTEILKRGTNSIAVFELQERINVHRLQHGLERIKVDGDFGPKTEKAVKELQASLNTELRLTPPLKVDGIWGPRSDAALRTWQSRGTDKDPAPTTTPNTTFTQEGYYRGRPYSFEAREIIDRVDGQRYILAAPVADAFEKMQEAAAKDGVTFNINSAFRSVEKQRNLIESNSAKVEVARPGYSAHNAGYAIDVSTNSDPKVANWIRAHGKEFGFDQRLRAEPWHWEHIPTREALAQRFGSR